MEEKELFDKIRSILVNYLKDMEKSGIVFEVFKNKKLYPIYPDEINEYMDNPDKWIAQQK